MIQVLLIVAILCLALLYYFKQKKAIAESVAFFLLIIAGIYFVLFPQSTSVVAQFLGVGRGTDLVFYCSFVVFVFFFIKLYIKIEKLESKLTEFIQKDALNKAVDKLDDENSINNISDE